MSTGKEKSTAEDDTIKVTGCLVLTWGTSLASDGLHEDEKRRQLGVRGCQNLLLERLETNRKRCGKTHDRRSTDTVCQRAACKTKGNVSGAEVWDLIGRIPKQSLLLSVTTACSLLTEAPPPSKRFVWCVLCRVRNDSERRFFVWFFGTRPDT